MVTGRRLGALAPLAIVASLSPALVDATDGPARARAALARRAQVIVLGRCTALRSSWNAEGTLISTYATYQVEEAVTGAARGQPLDVKALGGTVGRITQMVVDGPRFEVGRRDLLFLVAADEPGALRTLALGRGQWRVASDPRRGGDVVSAASGTPCGTSEEALAAAPAEPLGDVLEDLRRDRVGLTGGQ